MKKWKDFCLHSKKIFVTCLGHRFPDEVSFWICRKELVMTVRDLIAEKCGTNSLASCRFLYSWTEFFCCLEYSTIVRLWHFREMIYFDFRDDQSMPRFLWKNIEKCIRILIFIEFIRWDFPWDDARKESSHELSKDSIHCFYDLLETWRSDNIVTDALSIWELIGKFLDVLKRVNRDYLSAHTGKL